MSPRSRRLPLPWLLSPSPWTAPSPLKKLQMSRSQRAPKSRPCPRSWMTPELLPGGSCCYCARRKPAFVDVEPAAGARLRLPAWLVSRAAFLSGLFLSAGSLRPGCLASVASQQHRRCPQRQLRQEHQPGREPQMRSRRRAQRPPERVPLQKLQRKQPGGGPVLGQQIRVIQERGQGRPSAFCCRLSAGIPQRAGYDPE